MKKSRVKQFGAAHGCPNFELEPSVNSTETLVRSGVGGVLCSPTQIATLEESFRLSQVSGIAAAKERAGLRLVVARGRAAEIAGYLLSEMGMSCEVAEQEDGVLISVRTHWAFDALMKSLQGWFPALAAMNQAGQHAVKVFRA